MYRSFIEGPVLLRDNKDGSSTQEDEHINGKEGLVCADVSSLQSYPWIWSAPIEIPAGRVHRRYKWQTYFKVQVELQRVHKNGARHGGLHL